MKYRKKLEVIEAVHLKDNTPEVVKEVLEFIGHKVEITSEIVSHNFII